MINSTNEIFTIVIKKQNVKGKKGDKWKTNSFNTRLIVRRLGHLNSLSVLETNEIFLNLK